MKLTYNPSIERYVLSELGTIIHTTPDLGDAQRLMGIEPSPEDYGGGEDGAIDPADEDEEFDFSDLLGGLNNVN